MAVILLLSLPPAAKEARAALVDRLILLEARGEGHLVFDGVDSADGTGIVAVRIHRDAQAAAMADFLAVSVRDVGVTVRRVALVEDGRFAAAAALFP